MANVDDTRSAGYVVETCIPPIDPRRASNIYYLLQGFGPHYDDEFGVDVRCRLQAQSQLEQGTITAIVLCGPTTENNVVAHASVVFHPHRPEVGLLANVFTASAHRRNGLSRSVTDTVLKHHDDAGGRWMLLGTGSAHAAKVYHAVGFRNFAGNLDAQKKGYNPGDAGELLMLRDNQNLTADSVDIEGFQKTFFTESSEVSAFSIEVLSRHHWAGLVVLFATFKGNSKLRSANVDDGIYGEEKMLKLINVMATTNMNAFVCVDNVHHRYRRLMWV